MRFRLTAANLKAILLLDLIIVALASGGYFYVQTQLPLFVGPITPLLKHAEFNATDLTITPIEAGVGQPIVISVNVTNVGEEAGSHSVDLSINDVIKENETIQLLGGASKTMQFIDIENNTGSYSVKLEGLTGTFNIMTSSKTPTTSQAPTTPTTQSASRPANLNVYSLRVSPGEAWPGDSIGISATVTNYGDLAGNYSAVLTINGEEKGSQTVVVSGGASTTLSFTVSETNLGAYVVGLGTLTATFNIVPNGLHTLSIIPSPYTTDLQFTLDGQSCNATYSALLSVGAHTIAMPAVDPTGAYIFLNWEDGSKNPTRTIDLEGQTQITAYYSSGKGGAGSSCPSLYIWNGTTYVYAADVSDHGWLGYIDYINKDGSITFYRNNPWDYIPLDGSQLQSSAGYYNLTLIQRWDEIFYLDSAYMVVVDHPSDVNVYSTMVEQYLDPNYMGQIYTVSKNLLTPVSAVNQNGENVLPQISKIDGVFNPGINGINSPSWNNITWNSLTLNLGNLAGAKQIKLVVRAITDFGDPNDYTNWLNQFFAQQVPNGTQITPPAFMEVKNAHGDWVPVPESRDFPIPPDAVPRTYVVDLTGLFPTNDYELRINNFWNVTFDYIGVDTSPQENITIQRINPQATLYQAFSTNSSASGNFTRYGDVTQLLLNEDDEFVIGRQGDAVSLDFSLANLAPTPENWTRDVFLFEACWFKDSNGNWGFGFGFTVDPLPFHDMSGFPYPLSAESYPYDAAHLSYLQEYDTRTINIP
jgi:hypothetical protein